MFSAEHETVSATNFCSVTCLEAWKRVSPGANNTISLHSSHPKISLYLFWLVHGRAAPTDCCFRLIFGSCQLAASWETAWVFRERRLNPEQAGNRTEKNGRRRHERMFLPHPKRSVSPRLTVLFLNRPVPKPVLRVLERGIRGALRSPRRRLWYQPFWCPAKLSDI